MLRRAGLGLAGLLVLSIICAVAVVALAQGPRLSWFVAKLMPPTAGRITLGGGHVGFGALLALATGRPAAVDLDDLRVLDPEGTVVLQSDHLSASIEVHTRPTRIIIRDLRPGKAVWRFARMKSRRGIGFVMAFASRSVGVARPVARAPGPFLFQIANADLDGLDASLDFSAWALDLADVKATGSLLVDGRDPKRPAFSFDVHDIDARAGGGLRMLDEARGARLPFERAQIARIATTLERPDDLLLVVSAAQTGRSRLSGGGAFTGVHGLGGRSNPPGIQMDITLGAPTDALAAVGIGTRFGPVRAVGAGGQLGLQLSGPFAHLKAVVTGHGLDIAQAGRPLGRLQVQATASIGPLSVTLQQLELTAPSGGRTKVTGSLDSALELTGALSFQRVDTTDYLPPYLRGFAGGVLDGKLEIQAGLTSGAATLRGLDLTFERPAGTSLPRVIHVRGDQPAARGARAAGLTVNVPRVAFADGTLSLRRLSGEALGGRLTIDGQVRFWQGKPPVVLPSPEVTLDVRAAGIELDRAGLAPLFAGRLDVVAHAQGTLDHLALRLRPAASSRLEILGQTYRATGPFDLRVQDGALLIPSLPLVQEGGARQGRIELHGRASPAGQTDLHLTVSDRELTTLPGLRDAGLPMRGWFDARLRLSGDIADPALSGEVTLKDVALAGRPLGGGALTLTDPGKRSVRVRGKLFESFAVDGTLADRPGGPTVNVTLTMDRAALDALLPDLPPLLGGRATASGRVTMDVRPGRPAAFDGQFTELALSYQLPSRARQPGARVGIHSTGAVDVRMTGWGTQMTFGEAGFDFGAGSLRAGGTLGRGGLQAFARGPIDLARLAPVADALVPGLFDGLAGTAEADLRLSGTLSGPRVQGRLQITRPLAAALPALPGAQVRITAGALVLDDPNVVALEGVAAHFSYGGARALATADATLRLDGRVSGWRGSAPLINGRATIESAELASVALGEKVSLRAGQLSVADNVLTIQALEVASIQHGRIEIGGAAGPATVAVTSLSPLSLGAIDVPLVGQNVAYGPASGLRIDAMDLNLRLRGDAQRALTLAGTVILQAGRYAVDAPGGPAAPRKPAAAPAGKPAAGKRRPALADRVALDVKVQCDPKRFVVQHRLLPDLRFHLNLHAGGTAAAPRLTGDAGATGILSWLVLQIVRPFR